MTPAMIAALSASRKSVTGFFEIDLPSGSKRMLLGSGEVLWGSDTFKGYDPSFGSIIGGDSVTEDATGQAPNTAITVQVASSATKSDIASTDVQLAPVKIWLAAITQDVNHHFVAVADPELLFDGFIDQATISLDRKKDEIDYTLVSGFDYFFEDSEGQRLSAAFHHSVWPAATNEKGLDNVSGVVRKIYWGTYGPNGSNSAVSGGGGSYDAGSACVTVESFVLMADGSEKLAGDVAIGDCVWTLDETTGAADAFKVTAIRFAESDVVAYEGWPDASPDHRFSRSSAAPLEWFRAGDVGEPSGVGTVAKITVDQAHTYFARHPSDGAPWRLCHNVKMAVV